MSFRPFLPCISEGRLGCGRSGRWPVVSPIGFGGNPAGFARRARRDEFYHPGHNPGWWTCRGGASSGPVEHSVLGKSLDGSLQEWMLVLEPLEHSVPAITWIDGPLEGTPVLKPLEHSVLEKSSHDEPTEGRQF